MRVNRTITVTTSFVGFHAWAHAHDERAYLRSMHRHRFGVQVTVPVQHDDRDVEFHDLIAAADEWVASLAKAYDGRRIESCERAATDLARWVIDRLSQPWCIVRVSEDDECWATVEVHAE